MTDEVVIFERYIGQNEDHDGVFIRLSSESDTAMAEVLPKTIYIAEAFSYGSPIVTITFDDGAGVYNNLLKLNPDTIYWLTVSDGDIVKNSQRLPLKVSKLESKNMVAGKSELIAFKISFIHYGWDQFVNRRKNRGWSDTPYHEIVQEILGESGYDTIDVTPSRGVPEFVIQPYWTNNVFLKWIQERAISEDYDDHFEFGCRIDNKFFFKSISDLIMESSERAKNEEIPVLKLQGYNPRPDERLKEKEENYKVATYFTDYTATEYYMDSVINGAGGINAMFYDFTTGSFVQSDVTPSNVGSVQLSDWGAIQKSNEGTGVRLFGGRDVDTIYEAMSKLSSVSLSTNQFSITTEGSLDIHIGDMLELIIPTPENMIPPFSVMYSGFYLVAGVTHIIALEPSDKIITRVDLARQGFDGKELIGYVKSREGKFISDREDYTGKDYVQP